MIIKCKMCGGDIQFTPGDTYGTCEYCGSICTIPKADDEQKLNRYNRANHFRRQCEFDKAAAAYEKLLDTDDTDAEAHWGAVLCRFGIEYVEDPATKKMVPTCHRVQVNSVLADSDYQEALKYARDEESRKLYEEQAAEIARIQREILAVSANEKPYDIFICYKETDDNNQRTRDSVMAQEIYYELTEQGYQVFFSRISLEDKLGQQYEPYIFAALNSARVMLVIGTKPEYLNAVWVKNEWSRYLMLMREDRKRLLIPCYQDMDPYDLPDELSSLQSQDMGKLGFLQDLLHGIKKVLSENRTENAPRAVEWTTESGSDSAAPGIESLMKRAYLFMEDREFDRANEYLDRVLDANPEYAPAYAAKTCVALKIRHESQLGEISSLYNNNADWKKALRFADEKQRETYEAYERAAKDLAEKKKVLAEKNKIYMKAAAMQQKAVSENTVSGLKASAEMFRTVADYKDALQMAKVCEETAADIQTREYQSAMKAMQSAGTESKRWQEVKQQLESVNLDGYRDVDQIRRQAEEQHQKCLEMEQQVEKRKNIPLVMILIVVAIIVMVAIIVYFTGMFQ